jgi:hypothetical protein
VAELVDIRRFHVKCQFKSVHGLAHLLQYPPPAESVIPSKIGSRVERKPP